MESITLGDISNVLAFIAGILAAGGSIAGFMSRRFGKVMKEELKPLNDKIDGLANQVNQVDIDNTKNYLQQTISAVSEGAKLDTAARERFYENYDHYTNDLNLNSWVHKEVERLEKEGKL
jgi:conjugal transfer/entry exclusion protein